MKTSKPPERFKYFGESQTLNAFENLKAFKTSKSSKSSTSSKIWEDFEKL
jgi:hypothetical protein